jgi:hypothetical protein
MIIICIIITDENSCHLYKGGGDVLGKEGFEHLMGFHGAPFLTGMRPACLLSFQKSRFEDFEELLASYLPCFECKGISVFRLSEGAEFVLLLFYRQKALEKSLQAPKARTLLREMGYREGESLAEMLEFLHARMEMRKSFPHEVGLFLGYPPADVRGFIEHRGQGFACAGYWKVYSHEEEARALFSLYSECSHVFCTRLEQGAPFAELVQAV